MVEHLRRRPALHDQPADQHGEAVGHAPREGELVGHDHHRLSRRQIGNHGQHLADQARVEGRRGLVEEEDDGLHGESARDGDALLLPTRERGGNASAYPARPTAPAARRQLKGSGEAGGEGPREPGGWGQGPDFERYGSPPTSSFSAA